LGVGDLTQAAGRGNVGGPWRGALACAIMKTTGCG